MRDANHAEEPKRFEPKNPVQLDPPKDDPITPEYLAKCNGKAYAWSTMITAALMQVAGTNEGFPTLVAIKGTVFDVTKNEAYGPKGQYKVFAGKEPNRALAQSSLKPEDCVPEWEDLPDKEKTVLDEWFTFFSKRYNVVGKVQRANL
ncbi:putative progesterone binding protein [Phyllosticta citricarpa]